jgi:hypothetical protein
MLHQQARSGEYAIAKVVQNSADQFINTDTLEIENLPACPGEYYEFNWGTRTWRTPDNLFELQKQAKLSALAAYRYNYSTSGTTINEFQILTDPGSQAALTGAYTSMKAGLLTTVDWKAANGWMTLDLPTVTALAGAVADFVQGCFTREKNLAAQINAAPDAATLDAIDITAGWPT